MTLGDIYRAGLLAETEGRPEQLEVVRLTGQANAEVPSKHVEAVKRHVQQVAGKVVDADSAGINAPALGNPSAWAAEFAASPDLQSEFLSVDIYQAFRRAEKMGSVHEYRGRVSASTKGE